MKKKKITHEKFLDIGKKMISLLDTTENIMGKGENAGYQHFLLYPQCFPMSSSSGRAKFIILW